MKEAIKSVSCKALLRAFASAVLAALLLVIAAPAMAEETRSFQRMGLTIELPAAFGDPEFDFDEEVFWMDEAMQRDEPGIGVIVSLAPTREAVLDGLQDGATLSDPRPVTLGPRGFERFEFDFPAEGVSGIFYLSDEAHEAGNHVFLLIGTQPDNLEATRAAIDAIAERIEGANRIE